MRNLVTIFLIFLTTSLLSAQNIVPNPDFENFTSCPFFLADYNVVSWSVPTFGTSDYYNACSNGEVGVPNSVVGFQQSDAGDAYCGFVTFQQGAQYREYIQAVLDQPTIANACYKLSIYYNPADEAGFSDGLGMLLSEGVPASYVGQMPQLVKTEVIENSDDWHILTTDYISPGGETHITIGNFYNDANTNFSSNPGAVFGNFAYYLIDSVAVEFQGTNSNNVVVDIGEDLQLCEDDFPITIISSNNEATNIWNTGEISNSIEVNEPGIYYVDAFLNCEFNSDTILIEIYDVPEINIENTNLCLGEQLDISLDPSLGTYVWTGGSTGSTFSVDQPGDYSVDLTYECGVVTENFTVNLILPISLDDQDDLFLCVSELPTIVDYGSYNDGINEFLWQDGSTGQALFINGEGEYSLEVYNECFSDNISFEVFVDNDFPVFVPFDDTIACPGESKLIYIGFEGVEYLWQDNSTQPFYDALEPGDYSVTVSNLCKSEIFEFEIVEAEETIFDLGQDIELCPGDSVFLSAQNGLEVIWNTGENSNGIWVSEAGEFIGSVDGVCDFVFDTVNVSFNGQSPQLNLPDTLLLCDGDTLNIQAANDPSGISFEWNSGDNTNEIQIVNEGNYVVTGSNSCGITSDSVFIELGEALADSGVQDIYNICEGESVNILVSPNGADIVWSTGVIDSIIELSIEGSYFVQFSNSCKTNVDSFEINFIPELNEFDLGDSEGICQGDSIILEAPNLAGDIIWSTNESSNSILVDTPGTYFLEIEGACNTVFDSIEIFDFGTSPNIDLGQDLSFCSGDSVELSLDVSEDAVILWNTGSQESNIVIYDEGEYNVVASNTCGLSYDTIIVSINNDVPVIDLGEDQQLCVGDTIVLDLGSISGEILWNTGSEDPSIVVSESGVFSVSLNSSCGESNDTIQLDFLNPPMQIDLEDTIKNCFIDNHEINLSVEDDVSILWSTGSTDTFEVFFFEGEYSVQLSNSCGIVTESFVIENYPFIDFFELGEDQEICDVLSIELNSGISQENIDIIWNTGEEEPVINVNESGVYWVQASNECYELSDTLEIEFNTSPEAFNLGVDDTICSGEEIVLDGYLGDEFIYEWQDGNENSFYNVSTTGNYFLTVSNQCGVSVDSISFVFLDVEEIENPLDEYYLNCEGTPLLIDLSNVLANYIIWDDGSLEEIRELLDPGIYRITLINDCFENIVEFTFDQENCAESNFYIPNVFTPNFDNTNDIFKVFFPSNWEILNFELGVYNRWGENVFVSKDPDIGWDGTWKGRNLNPGVFAYIMKAEVELSPGEFQEFLIHGDITILK